MKRNIFSSEPETKPKSRKKSKKGRDLYLMQKNMDPKKFKKYLVQKLKLLKKELELNASVLRKNPTKIMAKIRQAELKAKLEETLRYIPRAQKHAETNQTRSTQATIDEIESYKQFIRVTVQTACKGYMPKEELLEKILEEYNLTKVQFFSKLGISEFSQFLKKESSVYVDFYGYVNTKIVRSTVVEESRELCDEVRKALTVKRFNSVFGEDSLQSSSKKAVVDLVSPQASPAPSDPAEAKPQEMEENKMIETPEKSSAEAPKAKPLEINPPEVPPDSKDSSKSTSKENSPKTISEENCPKTTSKENSPKTISEENCPKTTSGGNSSDSSSKENTTTCPISPPHLKQVPSTNPISAGS